MGVLNLLASIAVIVLALELLVAVLLFAAVCGGLWFGLRLGQKKSSTLFAKLDGYVGMAREQERRVLGYAALPFIQGTALGEMVLTIVRSLYSRADRGGAGP